MEIAEEKKDGPARFNIGSGVCFSPATEEGCIVLDVEQGTILSLNATAALIFSKLAVSKTALTRNQLIEIVTTDFEGVEKFRIENAVDQLIRRLKEKRVLQERQEKRSRRTWELSGWFLRTECCLRDLLKLLTFIKAYTLAALLLLLAANIILKFGGFSSLHRIVGRWLLVVSRRGENDVIATGCQAVNRACIWHPRQALCLQRAAVAVCLMRSLGVPAKMVIGVHKMPFYGHAWAEVDGKVINDHENVQNFFQVLDRC